MRAPILAVVLALSAAGCANDFPPPSFLDDPRVLALVAEPPELGFAESATVTAHTWAPEGLVASGTWRFCPFSLGASVGYACIDPACVQDLTPAGDTVTVVPANNPCIQAALANAPQAGLPANLPSRIEAIVTYTATAGAVTREAVLRLPVTYPTRPPLANANPVILQVEVGGEPGYLSAAKPPAGTPLPQLGPGGKLPVRVVLEAPEVTPAGLLEDSVISFFTTAGRFDYDRALGPDGSVQLEGKELAGAASPAQIWVVARDLRGGQAVKGPYWVEVTP